MDAALRPQVVGRAARMASHRALGNRPAVGDFVYSGGYVVC
jgi:hypothetical protein